MVAAATVVIDDPTASPIRTPFAAMADVPVPPLGTPRMPPTLIVIGALVPASVRVIGDAAAKTLELGSAENEELTVTKDMPLAKEVPCPKGRADIAPVVVRLVVPTCTSGTASSPVKGLAIGSDVIGMLDITNMVPARGGRSRAILG